MRREKRSRISLSGLVRRGKIFQEAILPSIIRSLIKSTGTTDRAPATIPSQNLRAPRGELSRYENIYPQMRIGRKVMITMGMRDNNSIARELLKNSFFEFKSPLPHSPYSRTVRSGARFALELLRFCTILFSFLKNSVVREEKSHLEVGFPLRCFQWLSFPNVATRRCQ